MDIKAISYGENFFYSSDFRDLMNGKIFSQKKIRIQKPAEIKEYTDIIWNMCDYVNSKPEGTAIICDRSLDDFLVPAEIKDFFLPNSVRVDPSDRRSKDILVRNDAFDSSREPDYNEYLNAISYIRGIVKRSWNEDLVSLSSIRKDVSLNDVFSKVVVKAEKFLYDTENYDAIEESIYANYDGSPYVSIAVTNGIDTYTPNYWNEYNSNIAEDFVTKFSIY